MNVLTTTRPTIKTTRTAREAAIVLTEMLVMRPNGYTSHDVVCAAYEVQEELFYRNNDEAEFFATVCGIFDPTNDDDRDARAIVNGVLNLISNQ